MNVIIREKNQGPTVMVKKNDEVVVEPATPVSAPVVEGEVK
jgi:hypothetical protein